MARYLTLSVSMPPEMADRLDEEAQKHGMKTSRYIRQVLREHKNTPFEINNEVIGVDENVRKAQEEGAA